MNFNSILKQIKVVYLVKTQNISFKFLFTNVETRWHLLASWYVKEMVESTCD